MCYGKTGWLSDLWQNRAVRLTVVCGGKSLNYNLGGWIWKVVRSITSLWWLSPLLDNHNDQVCIFFWSFKEMQSWINKWADSLKLIAYSITKVPYPQSKWCSILSEGLQDPTHEKGWNIKEREKTSTIQQRSRGCEPLLRTKRLFWSIRNQAKGGTPPRLSSNLMVRLLFYTGITQFMRNLATQPEK